MTTRPSNKRPRFEEHEPSCFLTRTRHGPPGHICPKWQLREIRRKQPLSFAFTRPRIMPTFGALAVPSLKGCADSNFPLRQ